MSEHLKVSSTSIGPYLLACAAYVGMDEITSEETFKWVLESPQLIKCLDHFSDSQMIQCQLRYFSTHTQVHITSCGYFASCKSNEE